MPDDDAERQPSDAADAPHDGEPTDAERSPPPVRDAERNPFGRAPRYRTRKQRLA